MIVNFSSLNLRNICVLYDYCSNTHVEHMLRVISNGFISLKDKISVSIDTYLASKVRTKDGNKTRNYIFR